jgi:hypothetical protein
VVEVAMAADDGLDAGGIDLQPVHIPDHPVGAGPGVEENLVPDAVVRPRGSG